MAHNMVNYMASILVVNMGRMATRKYNFEKFTALGPANTTNSSIFFSSSECIHLNHLIDGSKLDDCSGK